MEGDLGISLILVRPFLRDAKARIDVGTGKISLCIRQRTMKFRFQNRREQMYLIHEDHEGQGLWAEPEQFEDWEIHSLTLADPSPTPTTTTKKNKKVWRKKKTSSSLTSSPGMDDWTSS
jgi:hypothetical protein